MMMMTESCQVFIDDRKTCQAFAPRPHLHLPQRALRCTELCPEIVIIIMTMMIIMKMKDPDMGIYVMRMKRVDLHGPDVEVNVVAVEVI